MDETDIETVAGQTFFSPADIASDDEFLAGPYNEACDLDIDDIFGKKSLDEILKDAAKYTPDALVVTGDLISPSIIDPSLVFCEVNAGLLLCSTDTGQIIGGYIGCDLILDEARRGHGLGKEIVLEYYVRNGELPTWHLDEQSYSSDGERAHRAAWNWGRDPKVIEAKKVAWTHGDEHFKSLDLSPKIYALEILPCPSCECAFPAYE